MCITVKFYYKTANQTTEVVLKNSVGKKAKLLTGCLKEQEIAVSQVAVLLLIVHFLCETPCNFYVGIGTQVLYCAIAYRQVSSSYAHSIIRVIPITMYILFMMLSNSFFWSFKIQFEPMCTSMQNVYIIQASICNPVI